MISKEAELFERANVVDIGVQRNDQDPHPHPHSVPVVDQPMQSLTMDDTEEGDTLDIQLDDMSHNQALHGFLNDGDGDDGEDDDDGIGSLNIDEVDQPSRVPHITGNAVNGAIDSGTDSNIAVNEAFQRSLNERASQFVSQDGNSINSCVFPGVPKPKVNYTYTDRVDFRRSLDEWFSSREMVELRDHRICFQSRFGSYDFNHMGIDDKETTIEQLSYELNTPNPHESIRCLLFITMGAYEEDQFIFEEHISNIQRNSQFIVRSDVIPRLLDLLSDTFELCATSNTGLAEASKALFHICTILYLVILVYSSEDIDEYESSILRETFRHQNILSKMVKFIDTWRWNSRASMRIRNIIVLLSILISFSFGNLEKRKLTKHLLCEHLGIEVDGQYDSLPRASPIDFHIFRQDITTRYPSYTPPPSTLPSNFGNTSTSLLQYITPLKSHGGVTGISREPHPPPIVHISTPSPSPPPSSNMNKQLKSKRTFQTDANYPLLFPSGSSAEDVPTSIKEASELFASRVREKLDLKQLWHERDIFVKEERGWIGASGLPSDTFDYLELKGIPAFDTLNSIESFYANSLGDLSSLVHVLMQLIITSESNLDTISKSSCTSDELEMVRTKEILSKHASYILLLLLKWFKVSHVLKFEYLSSLICDSNYFTVVAQYLKKLDIKMLERVEYLTLFNFKNSIWVDRANDGSVDNNFCFSLINMLEIQNVISRGKTQRLLTIIGSEPAARFRNLLSVYNPSLWSPVLKQLKEITPFNGKKWKANNMDLISMVYLHGKTKLRDLWLSGRDVEAEINDAYGQEIALRALIQFYNMRRYRGVMEKLGYEQRARDFFAREVELASMDI